MARYRAQALYTAVRLRLPDHITAGRATSGALAEVTGAQVTGADPDGIHRLMRLLVAMGVFEAASRLDTRQP